MGRLIALLLLCLPGCLSPAPQPGVDREAALGLLARVEARAEPLVAEYNDPETSTRWAVSTAAVHRYATAERIPMAVSPHVYTICDIHDTLLLTDPNLPELDAWVFMRSTQLLRELFSVARE